ncbi:lecithin retinol acyltransferase family protein [Burkholderia ubonensis]|uniref:LRAT domain-containing protein n=1 Tax=Burkholderia ubonensis subsp. mesacidophila TaxID=265293 RepID=A0A2A4FGK7_9BURK|nr:lecithin retinol acyltransferase family protein [Burkholderia ubonensis]PCE32541.1 hypothetical protein BZL54_09990 [Burkholderia ubonensis subsp. mesacidophila]
MSIWDSIADAFSGIKDAVESFPAIMKDPYAVSIGHGTVPKLSMNNALTKGAVVKVSRRLGLYDHYGIYISDSAVVHFNNRNGAGELSGDANRIIKTTLKEFMDGSTELKVVTFPASIYESRRHETYRVSSFIAKPRQPWSRPVLSPNANLYKTFSADEIADRALGQLGKGGYDLVFNNCEHFAVWCATGVSESIQVQRIMEVLSQGGGPYR